jgi:hypothetical protein
MPILPWIWLPCLLRGVDLLLRHRDLLIGGRNYAWAAISGATWYVGFMRYGIGITFMRRYDFTSWSIQLAFVMAIGNQLAIPFPS